MVHELLLYTEPHVTWASCEACAQGGAPPSLQQPNGGCNSWSGCDLQMRACMAHAPCSLLAVRSICLNHLPAWSSHSRARPCSKVQAAAQQAEGDGQQYRCGIACKVQACMPVSSIFGSSTALGSSNTIAASKSCLAKPGGGKLQVWVQVES